MVPPWTRDYIGIPWKSKGRDRMGCDCLGLARLVWAEQFGLKIPSYDECYATAEDLQEIARIIAAESGSWRKVPTEDARAGDGVLLRVLGNPSHIGVVVEPPTFLHVAPGINACLDDYTRPHWAKRLLGIHRHEDLLSEASPDALASRVIAPAEILDPNSTLRSLILPHPFSNERIDRTIKVGATLAEILEDAGLPIGPMRGFSIRVFIDGHGPIPREWWSRIKPKAGRIVTARIIPANAGGGGGKNVLGMVLMVAVIVVAIVAQQYYAVALAGALGVSAATASALIGAGVIVAGGLLINAIAPPQTPSLGRLSGAASSRSSLDGSSPTLSITGTRNQMSPYGPIPRVYGRHRMFPPLGASTFTEVVGSDQYLRMVLVPGYGPLNITTIQIGDNPILNFQGVEVEIRQGYSNDTPLTLYTDDIHEDPLSVVLTQAGGSAIRTTQSDADEISVDIVFPNGLFALASDGTRLLATVAVTVEYRLVGATSWTLLAEDGDFNPSTWVSGVFRRGRRWTTNKGQYEVKLTRTTADSSDLKIHDQVFWSALRTIRHRDPITKTGLAKIGLRIKATDQLNGVVDQLNCIVESIIPDWDAGSGTWITRATSNPASIYRDILQGSANARPVADARIDLPGLQAWHEANATAGRFFNAIIDFRTTLFQALRDVAAVGRASFAMKDGKYSVVRDIPQTVPIQHFTPRNSKDFKSTKALPDLPHAFKARFINPNANWQQDERIVYDDGFNADGSGGLTPASKFEVLELLGVTDSNQAWRDGRYHIAVARLRPETYELMTDIEHLICQRGDLVKVVHDVPLWGLAYGRVKAVQVDGSGNATGVTVDEICTMEIGKSYAMRFRRSTGASVMQQVITAAGEQTTVTFTVAILAASKPAVGDLFLFGLLNSESVDLLVQGIDPGPDFSAKLTLVDASPAVHTADTGPIPAFESQITQPALIQRQSPAPIIDSVVSNEDVLTRAIDGALESRILVGLHFVSTTDVPAIYIQARYRETAAAGAVENKWINLAPVPAEAGQVSIAPVQDGIAYDIRIRSIGGLGETSEWIDILNHTVIGKTSAPPDVSTLFVMGTLLSWSYPNPPRDFAGFRVKARAGTASVWSGANQLHDGLITPTELDIAGRLGAGTQTIMVKAVDVAENESAGAAVLTLNLGDPTIDNIILTIDYGALGYPGTIVNGSVVGSEIRATSDASLYLPKGEAAYLPDGAALYLPTTYFEMSYAAVVIPDADAVPAELSVAVTTQGEDYFLEFRGRGDNALYLPIGSDLYLTNGAGLYLGGPEPYQPWPGKLEVTRATYDVRATVAAGATQGKITSFVAKVDVPDIDEVLEDVALASGGTRLPITKHYRKIAHVGADLQDTGTGAVSILQLDNDPMLGPLRKAINAAGAGVAAVVDFRVRGY
jgi:hypothetical protein